MSHFNLPSGLQRGLPFIVSADWTPEEALAVFELVNDLRDVIWEKYQVPIKYLLKKQRRPARKGKSSVRADKNDPPF
jgi:hypothetical protein